jgi:hypothetical protein
VKRRASVRAEQPRALTLIWVLRVFLIVCLPVAAGCQGGTALQIDGEVSGGGSSGAAAGANGAGTAICHGGCLCVHSLKDCWPGCYVTPNGACLNGPSPDGTSIRVPAVHRSAASTCPAQRAPGWICNDGPEMASAQCATDGDCTGGTNGRCSSPSGGGPPPGCTPFCSYDQCQSDADCPTHVPCECRSAPESNEANICVPGGNCAVDSDCGPVGYCSPDASGGLCGHPIYFCHTPKDTCTDDGDCRPSASGITQACVYDARAGHFACGFPCFPPG